MFRRLALMPNGTPQNYHLLQDDAYRRYVGCVITGSTRISDAEALKAMDPGIKVILCLEPGMMEVDEDGKKRRWDDEQQEFSPLAAWDDWGSPSRTTIPTMPTRRATYPQTLSWQAVVLSGIASHPRFRRAYDGFLLDSWPRSYGAYAPNHTQSEYESEFVRHWVGTLLQLRQDGYIVLANGWGDTPVWPMGHLWVSGWKGEDYWVGNGEAWRGADWTGVTEWRSYWDFDRNPGIPSGWHTTADTPSIFQFRPEDDTPISDMEHAINTFLLTARNSNEGPWFMCHYTQDWDEVDLRHFPRLLRRIVSSQPTGGAYGFNGSVRRSFDTGTAIVKDLPSGPVADEWR